MSVCSTHEAENVSFGIASGSAIYATIDGLFKHTTTRSRGRGRSSQLHVLDASVLDFSTGRNAIQLEGDAR
jgi:hypothetical protein